MIDPKTLKKGDMFLWDVSHLKGHFCYHEFIQIITIDDDEYVLHFMVLHEDNKMLCGEKVNHPDWERAILYESKEMVVS